ncbi:hypothetical protein [Aquimarina sp. 2201CG5-10]|uniref:hypothetical protein n=1 Tax=Aquimarina callyspongiae TaxID=3098150 RepID=UPI002AB36AE2|nr:hypothetical protein [Aquimarina sp. 2201CG5-10]MDY8136899.1 hypothetical protein [Aquimarina sp. 2201CG5-10]
MDLIKVLTLLFFIIKGGTIFSQEYDPWILGVGVNIVDNSGSRFDELLDVENNWNLSKLIKGSIERRFEYDFGAVMVLSINEFDRGKKINSVINNERVNYFAVDIMIKNYTSNYWKDPRHSKYDAYIIGGWGGNFFDWVLNNSINVGVGLNIKIRTYTWLNFQTIGKFSIDNNTPGNANHLQHSVSVVFWL